MLLHVETIWSILVGQGWIRAFIQECADVSLQDDVQFRSLPGLIVYELGHVNVASGDYWHLHKSVAWPGASLDKLT